MCILCAHRRNQYPHQITQYGDDIVHLSGAISIQWLTFMFNIHIVTVLLVFLFMHLFIKIIIFSFFPLEPIIWEHVQCSLISFVEVKIAEGYEFVYCALQCYSVIASNLIASTEPLRARV